MTAVFASQIYALATLRLTPFSGKDKTRLAKYFSKGQSVGIVGRIQSRKWDEDGTTRYGMEVIAKEVFFAGGKASEKKQESNNEFAADVPLEFPGSNDDLPF